MLDSRFPQIVQKSALGMQRAVHVAGGEVEFRALEDAVQRSRSGAEARELKWVPNRRDQYKGEVRAGTFYTRFSEYGTIFQAARPILGPAAESVEPKFLKDCQQAWQAALR